MTPAQRSEFTRRRALQAGAGGAAALAIGTQLPSPAASAAQPEAGQPETDDVARHGDHEPVELTTGTNICAAASRDGTRIVMDLVNVIWVLPLTGGTAVRLTGELQDATQPDFSGDGQRVVFQSYRDGNFHLWTVGVNGAGLRQLTRGRYDHREPRFSPDGATIAFSSDRSGQGYRVYTMPATGGEITEITAEDADAAMPSWSPSGEALVFVSGGTAIKRVTLATRAVTELHRVSEDEAPEGRLFGPSLSPGGDRLAYVRVSASRAQLMLDDAPLTNGEDVFGFAPRWLSGTELLYTADGAIRRRRMAGGAADVLFTASAPVLTRRPYRQRRPGFRGRAPRQALGIASPVVSRDGALVSFRALNALWLMRIGQPPRAIVDDGYFTSDPDFSPDGTRLVYASDRAGNADLWLRDLDSGTEQRITALDGAQVTPRFSPDGKRIAYQDQDGAAWILELASGSTRQVTPPLFQPGRPDFSPDGQTLVLAAVKPYSKRFREGTSQLLRVSLETGEMSYTEVLPFRSIATRGDDGPVSSPDGRWAAFVVESHAWVAPVDAAGAFTGPPRQVTAELTDSLAWRGSNRLVFLNGGALRCVDLASGAVEDVPVPLRWRPTVVREQTIIHAGAMWDGRSERLRRDVDLVLAGDRIAAVHPHRPGRENVDAGEQTVIPGLIDAHVHWHLFGRQWGDRQGRTWLAYGVTTTRSPGDPAYQMQETREALAAGRRVGPRYYATGEAIDGSRIYYNFMRPTLSGQQLRLELERSEKLDYDLIKTYVRLPVDLQRDAVLQAHQKGRPLTSHYLYPAADLGMDGMEHTGATNRLGYSHTVSELGHSYPDTAALFQRSGMSITPTLFSSSALYSLDRSLIDDDRTKVLFPQWEYQRLLGEAEDASDPAGEAGRRELANKVEMLLRIHRGGGFLIAGTDSPLDNVAVSIHMNMRAMVRYGFTPREALLIATRNPARWLGLESELGTIVPGAYADLAIVDGNPLADITAAAAVRTVVSGGRVYTPEELMRPFTRPAAADRPARVTGTQRAEPEADAAYWWHEPAWAHPYCCQH